jgi:MFS superfamily sulfate permease-like transporter
MGISNPNNPTPAEAPLQAQYNQKVIQLAFLVAVLYTASGALGLGVIITRFMSHPTISGFISGASVIIILSQVCEAVMDILAATC